MDVNEYLQEIGEWLLTSGLQILLILILMLVAIKVARFLSEKIFHSFHKRTNDVEIQKRTDTLSFIIRYVLNVVIFALTALMILEEFGVDIGPVLAAAGVVGVAVGFGSKTLVEDIISGFFILLEDQIRVGDVVQIAGQGGIVEKITLRMVILRDLAGNVHFVRNGQINVVTNMTKDYSRYLFDIGVAYREDVDEVIELIKRVDEGMRNDEKYKSNILEPIEILGLDKFADSALIIKARTKTKPIKQWEVAREFNRRLKKVFDENDIEIPFPHRTIYIGKEKDGQSSPLHIRNDHNQLKQSEE